MKPEVLLRLGAVMGAIVLIGAMTLPAAPEAAAAAARTPWWCVACGSIGTADLIQNIALFVPLGFVLGIARVRKAAAILLIVALTVGVELLQASAIIGRDASLGDVLANTIGGVLGWMVASRRRALLTPERPGALAAVVVIGTGFAIVAATTPSLLRPALSRAEYTRARVAPEVAGRPRFAGEVLDFAVNGETYADRDVPRS
ncbi:MAG: VanZ family protein, partial [Gemmatimonadales bacterium]